MTKEDLEREFPEGYTLSLDKLPSRERTNFTGAAPPNFATAAIARLRAENDALEAIYRALEAKPKDEKEAA